MRRVAAPEVTVLGSFGVRCGSGAVEMRPSSRKLVALLAVRGPLQRESAAGLLYPDLPAGRASGNIRTVLWRLREDADGLLAEEGNQMHLSNARVDLADVRAWCDRSLQGAADDACLVPRATAVLLPGWSDPWLTEPREELCMSQILALEANAQGQLMAGHFGAASRFALAAVGMDPLRESAVRLLVDIHLREGNTVEAVRRYRRFQQLLWLELEAVPGPALNSLVAPVLPGAAVSPREVAGRSALADLRHRVAAAR